MAQRIGAGTRSIPARLRELGFASYDEYLASSHWQGIRARYRAEHPRAGCFVCNSRPVELHHRTYKRLGNERPSDLLPLCRKCHEGTHAFLRARPTVKTNIWTAAKLYRKSIGRPAASKGPTKRRRGKKPRRKRVLSAREAYVKSVPQPVETRYVDPDSLR